MRNDDSSDIRWTLPLGRWGGRPARMHVFLVFGLVGTLYLSWLAGQRDDQTGNFMLFALTAVVVGVASLTLHVAAHIYAATQLAVPGGCIVVGPHGDFSESNCPSDPRGELTIALAGPGVNLLVALACLPGVIAASDTAFWYLLNPVCPHGLISGSSWLVALKFTLWFNWTLAVVNLLPARPFDGGPATMAIARLLYPRASRRRTERFVSRVGVFTGVGLLLAAIVFRDLAIDNIAPAWLPMILAGIVILFSRQRPLQQPLPDRSTEDELFGYDFSQGYTSLERSHARVDEADDDGPLERWLETRKQQRLEHQQELEAEEDALVDEILARVHENGLSDLSPEERMLLDRASERYRTRIDPS